MTFLSENERKAPTGHLRIAKMHPDEIERIVIDVRTIEEAFDMIGKGDTRLKFRVYTELGMTCHQGY